MKKFLVAFEVETIVEAETYEQAATSAYSTVKNGSLHISKLKEIKPTELIKV